MAPKVDLKTFCRILSSYTIKVAAQRDAELNYSTLLCILMLNAHCVTPAAVIQSTPFIADSVRTSS